MHPKKGDCLQVIIEDNAVKIRFNKGQNLNKKKSLPSSYVADVCH